MQFHPASRKKAKLRLGIGGPSGSGKTLGALMIAAGLGGRIAVADTERGSAELYAGSVRLANGSYWQPPAFDHLRLDPPYTPERFIQALRAAEAGGYDVAILDSITHEWSGLGGCLEMVDAKAATSFGGNNWSAWSDVTPRHRAFIDAINASPLHIIATMRSKTETAQETLPNGKKRVIKLGMKMEQREGTEFEFTTLLELTHQDHVATVAKDRTGVFAGYSVPLSPDVGEQLLEWLDTGGEAPPAPPPLPGAIDWTEAKTQIQRANTLEELKAAHAVAVTQARRMDDLEVISLFDRLKDDRKEVLVRAQERIDSATPKTRK
jgi:hypothetical protein